MYLICGRKKNMKKEKYEKGWSVNQRSGSTEKAGQRCENDAKSQELLTTAWTMMACMAKKRYEFGLICQMILITTWTSSRLLHVNLSNRLPGPPRRTSM